MSIDTQQAGAFASSNDDGLSIRFGFCVPGVKALNGFRLVVRIIHQADRFDPRVSPVEVDLVWQETSPLDLWKKTTLLQKDPHSHYGQDGVYLYRYQLWHKTSTTNPVTLWSADPFACQTDVGLLSAV